MRYKFYIPMVTFYLLIVGCSTNSNPQLNNNSQYQGNHNMQIEQIANDHGSLTKALKALNSNYSIEVLATGANKTEYRRTIAENLNNICKFISTLGN